MVKKDGGEGMLTTGKGIIPFRFRQGQQVLCDGKLSCTKEIRVQRFSPE